MGSPSEVNGNFGFSFNVGRPPKIELPPLRLVVVADVSGKGTSATTRLREVSRETLDAAWTDLRRELVFEIPNLLGQTPRTRFVKLPVAALADFEPARVVENDEVLVRVGRLRQALMDFGAGRTSAAEVEQALTACSGLEALQETLALGRQALTGAAPAPVPSTPAPATSGKTGSSGDGALDRILGMVDLSPTAPPQKDSAASQAVDSLISGVLGGGRRSPVAAKASPALAAALEGLERLLGRQLNAIMHHPQFQRAEATWRGLRLLVKHCNPRRRVVVELLDVTREELLAAFEQHILGPELAGTSAASPSLVLVEHPFVDLEGDVERLSALADQAMELQAPVLASLDLSFFGLDDPRQMASLRFLGNLLDDVRFTTFRALRDKEAARWLGLAVNRLLLRPAFAGEYRDRLGLEEIQHASHEALWGSPVWMVGSLVARSFAQSGWPTEITGMEAGCLEDLPVRAFEGPAGRTLTIPLEAFISQQQGEDFAASGLIALTCAPEGDRAYVFRAPVLRPAGRFTREEATIKARQMGSLPYQLLCSRLADIVGRNKANLVAGQSENEARSALLAFLNGLVGDTGPGAGAGVHLGQAGGRPVAELYMRLGQQVMNGTEVTFTIPI